MSTYTHPQDDPNPEPGLDPEALEARERPAPVLLGALAVALVALGVWWYAQHRDDAAAMTPAVTLIEPPPAATAVQETPRGAIATRTVTPRPAQARPVSADRMARPLAGNPLPDYPRTALRNGREGSVVLDIAVDARGVPTDVRVVQRSGDRDHDFDRAAIAAARQWRFDPAIQDGKAVASSVRLPVAFQRG